MCNILGGLIFNFAIEILTRSSPRFGKVLNGIGVDGVGVNFLFFCISLSCLHFAGVFALFFFCSFLFLPFFLFPYLRFFVFLHFFFFFVFLCFFVSFIRLKRVFSAHFQAVAVDCPPVFGYGETAKTRKKKGNFAPTPSTPTPSETFRAMLLFQDSDPMTQALGWPTIEERIPLRQTTSLLHTKIPQKYFVVMWAPSIA